MNTLFEPTNIFWRPQRRYEDGEYILRQGAVGDTFYILSKGNVSSNEILRLCVFVRYFVF